MQGPICHPTAPWCQIVNGITIRFCLSRLTPPHQVCVCVFVCVCVCATDRMRGWRSSSARRILGLVTSLSETNLSLLWQEQSREMGYLHNDIPLARSLHRHH